MEDDPKLPSSSSFRTAIQLANRVPIDRLPPFLERITTKLQKVASSVERQPREPMGILQMKLTTPEKGYKISGEKSLALGFSYTELFNFFERLDQIQEQLDSLS
eukprot:Gb_13300 [translate_table: standard]